MECSIKIHLILGSRNFRHLDTENARNEVAIPKSQVTFLLQYPFIEAIDIELIDFGTKPMRVGGVKVYYSQDDEVIMESPLTWGSNATVRASARIKISKWSFYIPVELSDFQVSKSLSQPPIQNVKKMKENSFMCTRYLQHIL